jgi:hypothetical protein
VGPSGGDRVKKGIEELRSALYEYYGALEELRTMQESMPMVQSSVKVPEKPEALILLEQCEALGLPLVEGGLVDQPHLWLEEVAVVRDVKMTFEMIRRRQQG